MLVALVGCSQLKLRRPAPARELYVGQLTAWGVRYSERAGAAPIFIMSAKYGLVELDQVIPPYDQTMRSAPPSWGASVVRRLCELVPYQDVDVLVMAGADYVGPLVAAVRLVRPRWRIHDPLVGMDLVQRRRWFMAKLGIE